jgi:hypothetical protein
MVRSCGSESAEVLRTSPDKSSVPKKERESAPISFFFTPTWRKRMFSVEECWPDSTVCKKAFDSDAHEP